MSLFWPAGQVLASLLGWMFITTESICTHDCVPSLDFNGWRGVMFSVGLITAFMAFLRLALFKLIESPKYLYLVTLLIRSHIPRLKSGQRMSAFKALHTLAQYNDNQDTLAGLAIDDIPGGFCEHPLIPQKYTTRAPCLGVKTPHRSGIGWHLCLPQSSVSRRYSSG